MPQTLPYDDLAGVASNRYLLGGDAAGAEEDSNVNLAGVSRGIGLLHEYCLPKYVGKLIRKERVYGRR
jgi:hypothetical protein